MLLAKGQDQYILLDCLHKPAGIRHANCNWINSKPEDAILSAVNVTCLPPLSFISLVYLFFHF